MKANELMIGDWVRLRYKEFGTDNIIVRTFQIVQIRKGASGNIEVWNEKGNMGDIEGIEPVALTAEILEGNGFKLNPQGSYHIRNVSIDIVSDGRFFANINTNNPNVPSFLYQCGRCVHELQHALRICEIDKEIKL